MDAVDAAEADAAAAVVVDDDDAAAETKHAAALAAGTVVALRRGQALIDRAVRRPLKGSRRSGSPAHEEQDGHGRAEHGSGVECPVEAG